MPPSLSTSLLMSLIRPSPSTLCSHCTRRLASSTTHTRPVPPPTPFVPDVPTFLSLIGRQLSTHASKFKSWDDLFTSSSEELKKRGLEPTRTRRYLLRWREKFRNGVYGLGGDLKYVSPEGVAELRVVDVPRLPRRDGTMPDPVEYTSISTAPGMQKIILNVPAGTTTYKLEEGQTTADLKKPQGFKLMQNRVIVGSHVQPVKGSNGSVATFKVQEGLWEEKLGRKIFGGERRRAETLWKMRVEENKKASR